MENDCKVRNQRVDELTAESNPNKNVHAEYKAMMHFRAQDDESFCLGSEVLDVKTMVMRHTVITENADENNSRPMSLASDYELTREDRERCEAIHQRPVGRLRRFFSCVFSTLRDCLRPGGVHLVQPQCCMLIPVC